MCNQHSIESVFPVTEGIKYPFVISGPCSVETRKQVFSTATELCKQGVRVFRGGIWKPRTRPNTFEGVGRIGLEWLQEIKKKIGMLVSTEVGNRHHVYEAIAYDIDILWLGSRTTVCPFAVQEIADTMKGSNIPVMIKNPINPELELWIGAIERFQKAGLQKIAAVHRGFSSHEKTRYRNAPNWEIPIELRRRMPHIPIICDPSHMGGKKTLLRGISQKALDMGFDGLMIESHICPEVAMSDANQQLTPSELGGLLGQLVVRESNNENSQVASPLNELRKRMDGLDAEILDIIEERMELSKIIDEHKTGYNISVTQNTRWNKLLGDRDDRRTRNGHAKECVENVMKAVRLESINYQTRVTDTHNEKLLDLDWSHSTDRPYRSD